MLNLPQRTITAIKRNLLKRQREIEKSIKAVEKDDPAKDTVLAEALEPGTESYIADTHNRIVALEEQLAKVSKSIKEALGKIRKGTYGRCEVCSQSIGVRRLLVMPTTATCVSCSQNKQL